MYAVLKCRESIKVEILMTDDDTEEDIRTVCQLYLRY